MVHRDDRAGGVGSPPGGARQGVLGDAEPVGQREQFVVAGLGLLGVLLAVRLVGQQHLGEHGAAALELRGAGLDLLPFSHARTQDAAKAGAPTSTTHIRQTPTGL